jgi:hypothetical protein
MLPDSLRDDVHRAGVVPSVAGIGEIEYCLTEFDRFNQRSKASKNGKDFLPDRLVASKIGNQKKTVGTLVMRLRERHTGMNAPFLCWKTDLAHNAPLMRETTHDDGTLEEGWIGARLDRKSKAGNDAEIDDHLSLHRADGVLSYWNISTN